MRIKLVNNYLLLTLIVLFALVLRIWQIGYVPLSPDWDEAALGYNAYSIIKTGRDEHGDFLPLIMKSFSDYKPALYVYFVIPFIALFDLNLVAVRLPSVIIGTLSVIGLYFLIKVLINRTEIALVASFLYAVNPWHLQFSRVAFEASVGFAFCIFFTLFFIKGLKNVIYMYVAVLFAALNIYMYQSEKLFTPLLFLILLIIYKDNIIIFVKKRLIHVFFVCILGFLLLTPFFVSVITVPDTLSRAKSTSIFSDKDELHKRTSERFAIARQEGDVIGQFLYNRRVTYGITFINNYIVHFDLNWLYMKGDIPRHHAPSMGLLYLVGLPILLIGFYIFLLAKKESIPVQAKQIVFIWLLLAPLPAAFTSDVPHAVRAIHMIFPLMVISAYGIVSIYTKIVSVHPAWRLTILGVFTICALFNFAYYLNQYFLQQNYFHAADWQYGYKEAINKLSDIEKNYDKIIVSNISPLDQSYIFFLFYQKVDPNIVQYIHKNSDIFKVRKYEFRPLVWDKEQSNNRILYVGSEKDFPKDVRGEFEIRNPNKSLAIKGVIK